MNISKLGLSNHRLGYLLVLFVVVGFCTRVITDGHSSDKSVFVKVKESATLEIIRGEINEIMQKDDFKIIQIHFQPVRGGATYWFGKIKTNVHDGNEYKRLSLLENGIVKKRVSLNDILKLESETIDTMEVYPLYLEE